MLPSGLRHAMRRWRHRPGLAATAVLVLSLGIGSTTAMFSIVDGVLLAEEPWPDADRLVRIHAVLPAQRANPAYRTRWDRMTVSSASWRDLQRSPAFEDVAAWVPAQQIVSDERPELVRAFYASSNLLAIVGVRPALGRGFEPGEDEADSGTAIISHGLWQRLFGGNPDILGTVTSVTSAGQGVSQFTRRTIVGVLPEDFTFPGQTPDVLIPIGFHAYNASFGTAFFSVIGRLAPGVSPAAATTAAEPLVRRDEPADRRTARVVPLKLDRIGIGDRPLWLMFAGAALLLIVACSNVAGLLLGDARTRRHETAVRLALGGSRGAIVRMLMAEHALLGAAAAIGGIALAYWLVPALIALAPPGLMGAQTIGLDARIAAWSVAAALGTTLLAGLVPASSISSTRPGETLKHGSRESTRTGRWKHRTVVAAQFSLALVLLVGAGLFGETLLRLGRQPLGFLPDGVGVLSVARGRPGAVAPLTPEEREQMLLLRRTDIYAFGTWREQQEWIRMRSLLDRVAGLPGITHVAAAAGAPFSGSQTASAAARADNQPADAALAVPAFRVSEQYFDTLGIPVLRGREFTAQDRSTARAVIVSAELERRLFDGNALGRTLHFGKGTTAHEVIGIVGDVRASAQDAGDAPALYMLAGHQFVTHLIVRTSGDVRASLPALRQAIEGHDEPMFVTSMAALPDLIDAAVVLERARAVLSGTYGLVALLLATIGLYGLAARVVADRRREIGIRIALGAGPGQVRRLVMADAWLILGIGLVVGLPAAVLASRLAQGLLYGVAPTAPHILAVSAAALGGAAVIATVVPSWRASRIDPVMTLRDE